ncbi:hypothetical protein V6Z12_A13G268300 [Gossypium hirsutum]
MGCFCFSGNSSKGSEKPTKKIIINNKNDSSSNKSKPHAQTQTGSDELKVTVTNEEVVAKKGDQLSIDVKNFNLNDEISKDGKANNLAQSFTFEELATATGNFRSDCFLGEGGFGKVYKGFLDKTSQVVAIKQLDRNGAQGIREFVVEVLTLSMAEHPNLVKLIGFCAEGDQRLLVYEYMPLGSLENHLYELPASRKPLDWNTRMKIAAGAARGLEYLHEKMKPPVIYRDLKCSNILLGEGYHPKLSDFGLAKVGPIGDKTHVSTRVMGTYGYCAPDYAMTGQLTFKSDIYSFGVVLLELITGRKAIDETRDRSEQNLVAWVRQCVFCFYHCSLMFRYIGIVDLTCNEYGCCFVIFGLYGNTVIAVGCLCHECFIPGIFLLISMRARRSPNAHISLVVKRSLNSTNLVGLSSESRDKNPGLKLSINTLDTIPPPLRGLSAPLNCIILGLFN